MTVAILEDETLRVNKPSLRAVGALILALSATGALAQTPEKSELPTQTLNAVKLAGLAGFVNINCEALRTDNERFKSAVRSMGVEPGDLDRDALMLQARSYLVAYQKDVPANCTKADALFGRSGRIIPGIFVPR